MAWKASFGFVIVAQYLTGTRDEPSARAARLQRGEGRLVTTGHEPVEKLRVGEASDRADLEKHPKVTARNRLTSIGHGSGSGPAWVSGV